MRYRPAPDALSASLSDGAVLLHLYTKRYFSLNETGSRIWSLLNEQSSEEQIVDALVQEFDVEAETARHGVQALVRDLLAERLIEPATP